MLFINLMQFICSNKSLKVKGILPFFLYTWSWLTSIPGTIFAYGVTSSGKTHTMHVSTLCFVAVILLHLNVFVLIIFCHTHKPGRSEVSRNYPIDSKRCFQYNSRGIYIAKLLIPFIQNVKNILFQEEKNLIIFIYFQTPSREFLLRVSYLEIYNEVCFRTIFSQVLFYLIIMSMSLRLTPFRIFIFLSLSIAVSFCFYL